MLRAPYFPRLLLFLLVRTCLASQALGIPSECTCGYSINGSSAHTRAIFTELLETDFLHLHNIRDNACWQPQGYNVSAAAGRGKYGKAATLDNVVANPFPNASSWAGDGVLGGNAGLRLWVNSTLVGGLVAMGEIASRRVDMLYGSFRVGMKLTDVPGTCGAFFWYRNNSEEIDMEFLSSSINGTTESVYLVMQTPESLDAGYNAAGTPTYKVVPLPFSPWHGFHEYRFDWMPDKVSFFVDSNWLQDLYWAYPNAPGHLSLNHWSNGNLAWSRGPPNQDAVITISYVKAYFNSSSPELHTQYASKCSDLSAASRVCPVPDQTVAPEPWMGKARTLFFNRGMCGEDVGVAAAASTGESTAAGTITSTSSASLSGETSGASISTLANDDPSWFCYFRIREMAAAAGFTLLVTAFFL